MKKNSYWFISVEKEIHDINSLIEIIKKDNWIEKDTVIINCSPDYSSICTQIINHKLSFINNDELFEIINLQMPYPIMSQVWCSDEQEFLNYEHYLTKWISKYIKTDQKYLFIDSGTLRGINFSKLENHIKKKLPKENYKFASLYLQNNSKFTPNYFVERFDKETQGGLIFWWENSKNPNWDY